MKKMLLLFSLSTTVVFALFLVALGSHITSEVTIEILGYKVILNLALAILAITSAFICAYYSIRMVLFPFCIIKNIFSINNKESDVLKYLLDIYSRNLFSRNYKTKNHKIVKVNDWKKYKHHEYILNLLNSSNSDDKIKYAKLLIDEKLDDQITSFAYKNLAMVKFANEDIENTIKYAIKSYSLNKYDVELIELIINVFEQKNDVENAEYYRKILKNIIAQSSCDYEYKTLFCKKNLNNT